MAAAEEAPKRRQRSCLAVTISSAIDGGIFGAAIGSIMASGSALQLGFANGGMRLMLRSGMASAFSVGGFLASYNGGVCYLERFRKKRDVVNPAVVGGVMGMAGALPGYLHQNPQAPWAYKNPRAVIGGGMTSALLCSFLWSMSHMGAAERAERSAEQPPKPSAEEAVTPATRMPAAPVLAPGGPLSTMPPPPAGARVDAEDAQAHFGDCLPSSFRILAPSVHIQPFHRCRVPRPRKATMW